MRKSLIRSDVTSGKAAAALAAAALGWTGAAVGQSSCGVWGPLGAGMGGPDPRVWALEVYDGGGGANVFAAGAFTHAGGAPASGVARWDGEHWHALGAGIGVASWYWPTSLTVHGARLVVGGEFYSAGGHSVSNVAAWDGSHWEPVGAGLHLVGRLATYNGELIAGALDHPYLARYDGQSWDGLGGGMWQPTGSSFPPSLSSLAVHGGSLYVGGTHLALMGSHERHSLLRWDGATWHTNVWSGGSVGALAVYKGFLVAAENRTLPGSMYYARIHQWDGASWHVMGQSLEPTFDEWVDVLTMHNGALVAGGRFQAADGAAARYVASFDGEAWQPLASGVNQRVRALLSHDGALFVGGDFTVAGGKPAVGIAMWRDCPPCFANCDGSTVEPVLNVDDFTCFINEFAAATILPPAQQTDHYANCDGSTVAPVLNVDDFTCFINAFAAGCR